tara:strand:+ start:41 stop:439 length:399 start_codon:yes stop_codon:yes gene_type:complete
MRLFNNLFKLDLFLKFFAVLITFYNINNLFAFELDKNQNTLKIKENVFDFEKLYFQNSIPYHKYDYFNGQLKLFFGYSALEPEKSFYPDSLIIDSSNSIRKLYKSKLDDMTIRKFLYNIIYESSFRINDVEE